MTNYLIISHSADLDGVMSAFFAKMLIQCRHGEDVQIETAYTDYPQTYDDIQKYADENTVLYLTDLSFKTEEQVQVLNRYKQVYWYDHHVSSLSVLDCLPENVVEHRIVMDLCATEIVYDELAHHENRNRGPLDFRKQEKCFDFLVECTHSEDLYTKHQPCGEIFSSVVQTLGPVDAAYEIGTYLDECSCGMGDRHAAKIHDRLLPEKFVRMHTQRQKGEQEILDVVKSVIRTASMEADDPIRSYNYVVLFCPSSASSVVGDYAMDIFSDLHFVLMIDTGTQKCSLRSSKESNEKFGFSMASLAQRFGGGGHAVASGFSPDDETWLDWMAHGIGSVINTIDRAVLDLSSGV